MNEIIKKDMEHIISEDLPFHKLFGKTILITGATGMLAKYMVYTCILLNEKKNANIHILALVRNEEKAKKEFGKYTEKEYFEFLVQDVCDPIFYEKDVHYIFHAAGNASAKSIVENPTSIIKANTIGTIQVMEFAKTKSIEKVLYTSTREVYGKISHVSNITEEMLGTLNQLEARSCYPESKKMGETILKAYYEQYEVPYQIARIAHSYGPGMSLANDGRVMADILNNVTNEQNVVFSSDGSAVRAFCYIEDAIKGLFYILLKGDIEGVYNLSNEEEPCSIKEVAELAIQVSTLPLEVICKNQAIQAGYSKIERVELDSTKLRNLGWKPTVSLEEGLRRTITYAKETK